MKKNIWKKLEEADKIPDDVLNKAASVIEKEMEKATLDFKNKQAETLVESANKIVI